MKSKLILPNGSSARGAQMGRRDSLPEDKTKPIKLRMEKLRWVDGDYDQFGAYWGNNTRPPHGWDGWTLWHKNIYCAYAIDPQSISNDFSVCVFVRAVSRADAKEKVKELLPKATFFV